ncbi:MAG: TetR/AcrR family transcriptional regulator [Lysobacteraceae bacterium]
MATSPNPRRSPGRPAANDGSDGQRDRLLDAALTCFVRDRIAATTARRIADEAGVTPALLNYYFGGRDGLLQAVLEERLMPVMQRVRAALDQAGDDPAALVSGFSRAIADAMTAHPWLPMLWVREVLLEAVCCARCCSSALATCCRVCSRRASLRPSRRAD